MTVTLGGAEIGRRCFVIAEAGVNHNKQISFAKQLIDIAKNAGADTIKFHAYDTDEVYIKEAEAPSYIKKNMKNDVSFYDMAKSLELTEQELADIKLYCDQTGIHFSCTPYGNYGIKLMNQMGCDFFKISSSYLECTPFLKKLARIGKPLVLSTGMGDIQEVKQAISDVTSEGNHQLVVLHCTTSYPCPYSEANLNVIRTFIKELNVPIGYSDHTEGIIVPVLAAQLGAVVIEKHFTMDRNLEGPDHKASLESAEFKKMIDALRYFEHTKKNLVECALELRDTFHAFELVGKSDEQVKELVAQILGTSTKHVTSSEQKVKQQARLSIVSCIDIQKHTVITEDMLKYTRPGTGLSPRHYLDVIGKISLVDIPKNKLLTTSPQGISYA